MLLHQYYNDNTFQFEGLERKIPNLAVLFLGGLSFTLLIAYIFVNWARINSFTGGLMAGLIIGFFIATYINCYDYAFLHHHRIRLLIVDTIAGTLFTGILGGVIGWMIGKLENKPATG